MAHWEFVVWAVNGLVGLSTWRNVPLAVVRLIGALTKDPQRSRQCDEVIKLSRKDAKDRTRRQKHWPQCSLPPSTHARTEPGSRHAPRTSEHTTGLAAPIHLPSTPDAPCTSRGLRTTTPQRRRPARTTLLVSDHGCPWP
jgi:hypothetical protein